MAVLPPSSTSPPPDRTSTSTRNDSGRRSSHIQKRQSLLVEKSKNNDDSNETNRRSSTFSSGMVRSSLYVLQKYGVTKSVVRTAVKKKAFMTLGQRNTTTLASPWPIPPRTLWKTKAIEMIKGTLLGVTVFGVYDYLILKRKEAASIEHTNSPTSTATNNTLHPTILKIPSKSTITPPESSPADQHPQSIIILHSQLSWHLDDPQKRIPLYMHIQAGALAGLMQSLVLDTWEMADYLLHHPDSLKQTKTTQKSSWSAWSKEMTHKLMTHINGPLVARRALHHSLGYATLFGTYEALRSNLVGSVADYLTFDSDPAASTRRMLTARTLLEWGQSLGIVSPTTLNSQQNDQPSESYDVTGIPLLLTFVAGGVAGQAHECVTHYLRQWRRLVPLYAQKDRSTKISKVKSPQSTKDHHHHRPRPWKHVRWQSLLGAFLPTGLSFVAFQYAEEWTEQWLFPDPEAPQGTTFMI